MRGCETGALGKEASVSLVPSFTSLLRPLSCVMTAPGFATPLTLLAGRASARRRAVTGIIVAADAVGEGHKHHSSYHRLFAAARWSPDELGLAVFGLVLPLPGGAAPLAADDTPARERGLRVFGAGSKSTPHWTLACAGSHATTRGRASTARSGPRIAP